MTNKAKKYNRRRLRSTYISTVISISLVLFVLGLLGIVILNAQKISTHVKENIGFSVILKPNLKEVDINHIQKTLDAEKYVRRTIFISSDSAANILKDELGEDFVNFLGYNPLLPTIQIKLNPEYANNDSLAVIQNNLSQNNLVKEAYYQKDLVSIVNSNLRKISIILLIFTGLLLLISIALINSSIRLSVYSKRFLIRTMQLVGAKHRFIRKPFVLNGILNGIVSAIIALGLLVAAIYFAEQKFPAFAKLQENVLISYVYLFFGIIMLGIIISWLSTTMAIRKYLRIRTDRLYT